MIYRPQCLFLIFFISFSLRNELMRGSKANFFHKPKSLPSGKIFPKKLWRKMANFSYGPTQILHKILRHSSPFAAIGSPTWFQPLVYFSTMFWFQPLLGFDPITWFQPSNLVEPSHSFNSLYGFNITSSSIAHFCFVPHYLVFTITPGLIIMPTRG